ncbi:M15 family metallopeptidase [Nitratidesulfovibrio sp.]|uniref:M15 family metallopeptidase n=1 Tax=Nitratidesulfovibrio sp. TaxID=2802297 RepID=UPI003342272E
MNRRRFLIAACACALHLAAMGTALAGPAVRPALRRGSGPLGSVPSPSGASGASGAGSSPTPSGQSASGPKNPPPPLDDDLVAQQTDHPNDLDAPPGIDDAVRDYLFKMRRFDSPHPSDITLPPQRIPVLHAATDRLGRLERTVGHGFFYLLGFDEAVRVARRYPAVGSFSPQELALIDELFHADASAYGFMGMKPLNSLTATIPSREVYKVPGMGNYVYQGEPRATWETIRRLLGEDVVLTSGVRGIMKQFHLFLTKASTNGGNLSLASRSLAPPGYSFHGIGDFDVGQRGYGARNFTSAFTATPVFRRLEELGYITLRYPQDNMLGVRFEPWHIKVATA